MIDLRYSLVIEATEEPDFFSFYSPDLEGFSDVRIRISRIAQGAGLESQLDANIGALSANRCLPDVRPGLHRGWSRSEGAWDLHS
jgi:hypothetical protein